MGGGYDGIFCISQQFRWVKITNCILVRQKWISGNNEQACIRGGACADVLSRLFVTPTTFYGMQAKDLADRFRNILIRQIRMLGPCAFVVQVESPWSNYYRLPKLMSDWAQESRNLIRPGKRLKTLQLRLIAMREMEKLAAEARKASMSQNVQATAEIRSAFGASQRGRNRPN